MFIRSILFIDVDECATNQHRCSQGCKNSVGSYLCSCVDGFTLDNDGYTCNGNYKLSIHWLLK